MDEIAELFQPRCSATTKTGQPCRYPAVPGSDPPLCDLHGKCWLKEADPEKEMDYYGRFLSKHYGPEALRQMEQAPLTRELIVARAMVERLLDHLQAPDAGEADSKVYVPLIYRGVKLISDLSKQLGGDIENENWDEVLERLGDELGLDL